MIFVINEWLPEYFKPSASDEDRQKLSSFLQKMITRKDVQIIVREPSPFLQKLYRFGKYYPNDPLAVQNVKNFIRLVIQDSNKCKLVGDDDFIELPEDLINLLREGNYGSDKYLFEAAYTLDSERIIVTTDERLKTHMEGKIDCDLVLLDEFLKTF